MFRKAFIDIEITCSQPSSPLWKSFKDLGYDTEVVQSRSTPSKHHKTI